MADPIRSFAELQVGYPLRFGRVDKHGWVFDHTFVDQRGRTQPTAGEPRQPSESAWYFNNTVHLLALNALILKPYMVPRNETLGAWAVKTGVWELGYPPGFNIRFMSSLLGSGSVQSKFRLPANSWFQVALYRYAAGADETAQAQASITFGKRSLPHYRLVLPWAGVDSGQDSGMSLWRMTWANPDDPPEEWYLSGVYTLLDDFGKGRLRGANRGEARYEIYRVGIVDNRMLIWTDQADDDWLYGTESLQFGVGPIGIDLAGGCGMFNFGYVRFVSSGTAVKAVRYYFPAWSNAAGGTLTLRKTEPTGTSATGSLAYDPGDEDRLPSTLPTVTLTGASVPVKTPVVYLAQEKHPVTTTGSNPAMTDMSADLISVSWRYNSTYRGASLEAEVYNDDGQWNDLKGNEWLALKAAHDLGAEPATPEAVFSGWLTPNSFKRSGEDNIGRSKYSFSAGDWFYKLTKKKMVGYGSFAGWTVGEAFRYIMARCGIPADYLDVDSLADSWEIPCVAKSELAYTFSVETGVIDAMDKLCEATSFQWGSMPDGTLKLWPITGGLSSVEFVISEDSTGEDMIEEIEAESALENYFNIALRIGADEWGSIKYGLAADTPSILDETHPRYVGDDWWDAQVDQNNDNPQLSAQNRILDHIKHGKIIRWRRQGLAQIVPGTIVQVEVSNIGIPAGTIFEVLDVEHTIEAGEGNSDWRMNISAGIVSLA